MNRTLPQRLHAVLLLGLFAGGGIGLPVVDGFLYHSGVHSAPDPVHIDPPGGCNAHAEHCALTAFASARDHVLATHQSSRFEVTSQDYIVRRAVPLLRSFNRNLLQPSRAPPSSAS